MQEWSRGAFQSTQKWELLTKQKQIILGLIRSEVWKVSIDKGAIVRWENLNWINTEHKAINSEHRLKIANLDAYDKADMERLDISG